VTSGAANVYTTNAVQLIASTAAALYITGIYAEEAAVSAATYKSVQLMVGGAGAETVLGQYLIAPSTGSTVTRTYRPIFPPIPVANAARISVKTADSVGALATLISLECIAQSNVVDDGIAVGTVTTVTNQLTGAAVATAVWQDATAGDFTIASSIGKALYIANVAPGAAGGHFISGSNAGTTTFGALTVTGAATLNVTGNLSGSVGSVTGAVGSVTGNVGGNVVGSVASVTAAVILPSIPANWITAAGINAAALNGKGDWSLVGSAMTLTAAYDPAKTALTVAGYTAPDNTSITAIKAKTDSLTFTQAGKLDVNVLVVNGITLAGAGTAASPMRAA
jgi:hypothetical protein